MSGNLISDYGHSLTSPVLYNHGGVSQSVSEYDQYDSVLRAISGMGIYILKGFVHYPWELRDSG